MRNKWKKKLTACFSCLLMLCMLFAGTVPVSAAGNTGTAAAAQSIADGIINFKLKQTGTSSVQEWINDSLTKQAGSSSEWYVLALSQSGKYDFSSYQRALKNYLANNTVSSASSRQKYALALITTGSTDPYIASVMEDSIGKQGVMSWIFGLHLLNNGYSSSTVTTASALQKLLSLQLSDGGWAVMGKTGDNDVTAMAVQALAPHYGTDSTVKEAVDKALSLLSSRQLAAGDYSGYGVPNPESTAQVITALSALGIDCGTDGRFIKNGKTLLDGLRKYQLSDGSFCHESGGEYKDMSTVQTFYSMVSYVRMASGKAGLYILDNRNPTGLSTGTSSGSGSAGSETGQIPSGDTTADPSGASQAGENGNKPAEETEQGSQLQKGEESGERSDSDTSQNGASENSGMSISAGNEKEKSDITKTDAEDTAESGAKSGSYKSWVCLVVIVLAGAACLVLYLMKKRNRKNFIFILVAAAIAVCFVLLTDFQSTDSYYNDKDAAEEEGVGTVTMTIRCDSILDNYDQLDTNLRSEEYVPEDGVILPPAQYVLQEGDTVFDLLVRVTAKEKIQMEYQGADQNIYESAYIQGINYLYEFSCGPLSGWMYRVDGEFPNYGCSDYKLKDGDVVEWVYTCNLGKDVGNESQ